MFNDTWPDGPLPQIFVISKEHTFSSVTSSTTTTTTFVYAYAPFPYRIVKPPSHNHVSGLMMGRRSNL